uniref:WW domain-containing protein n=1 Tax=Acrobeloides nanus TaxID=290746 RepID=A0A914BUW5_9BILA
MSTNSDQIICAYCRKLHSNEKDVFLEAIRKELPNYQNMKCAKCDYTSNNANDVSQHFEKIHGGCNSELKFELKLNPYLEALCERIFIESQIYTDSGIDTAATHTLVSDESNLQKPDQNAPIQKAASSLVVESLPEENMVDLLKTRKEQIKNQRAKQFSAAVSGTPWHVVWTQDGNSFKLFFYNLSSKTSVWQRPSELYNRKDVDLLVSQPPVGKFMTMPNDLLRMDFHVENLEEEIPLAPFVQPLHIVAKPGKPTNAPTDVLNPHPPRSKPTPEERRAERQAKKEYYHGIGQAKERYQNRMARKKGWKPEQHFAFK